MKKSKKALLWTIVPVLGVSSGVAGAVAGVTSQKTSVDTNNVATSSSATTMATKSSSGVANKLKIVDQTYDVVDIGGKTRSVIYVKVSGSNSLRYEWKINKGEGWSVYVAGPGADVTRVSSEKTSTILKWTLKCVITDTKTKESITSEDVKVTILPERDTKEVIKITDLSPSQRVKVGEEVALSATATSTKTKAEDLKYQWYRSDAYGKSYEKIDGANSSKYMYKTTEKEVGKKLFFCVLVTGTTQDGQLNHFQSDNVEVEVLSSDGTLGSATNGTFANDLSVTSSVTTNQASVRRNFYPVSGINTPTYTVDVKSSKSASELTYKWYYVSGSKKELISGANENVLTTNKNLYETVYKANDKHKVGIVCEIYSGDTLVKTVDQSVNSSFYMTVVITRR